nr:pyruvate formate lyase-activating protein [Bacilli bacterium]
MQASINSIESCGTVDGPGIRAVIFFNECHLRCKYCHNPEMWHRQGENYTPIELSNKIKRYKPYFGNNGGVTFSGGEPLLHQDFLIELSKLLKEENIHIALDTAGYGLGNYEELLSYIDLIIFDIKDINEPRFKNITGGNINKVWEFLDVAKRLNKKFWIRQVIVPGIHDNETFLISLNKYIKEHFIIDNIERIEFLPYHKLGSEKYETLNIPNPY